MKTTSTILRLNNYSDKIKIKHKIKLNHKIMINQDVILTD
jgi:hypothetical protein